LFVDLLGYAAGILTTSAIIPEILKVVKKKKADELAYSWLEIIVLGMLAWTAYGFLIKSWPLTILSAISGVLYFVLIILKYEYAQNDLKDNAKI
jgi:MtN3 and saliva related transmembrane protein